MSLKQLASLIPAEYRREILLTNMIGLATPVLTSYPLKPMNYLVTIWTTYCDPNFSPSCGKCLSRLIDDFKQLQPVLVQLEKEANILKEVI